MNKIRIVFTDVGGVLLTNGWDTAQRKDIVKQFGLHWDQVEERHQQVLDEYECGKMTMNSYLHHVIFYEPRTFTIEAFKEAMFSYSKPHTEMLKFIQTIPQDHKLRLATLSNEGKEMAMYRFNKFNFHQFIDFFVVSSIVGYRKPDSHIYHLALDLAQVKPEEALYIDDRPELVEKAKSLGIHAIHHENYATTKAAFEDILNG